MTSRAAAVRTLLALAAGVALGLGGLLWIQRTPPAVNAANARAAAAPPPTADRVAVMIADSQARQMGIRTETVGRETLARDVRAVATVAVDESRLSHVHTRIAGWVEHLDVSTTGEFVHEGEPLARIFSQELLASQTEYLAARTYASQTGITSAVVASGRTRLTVLGMTEPDIEDIERTGEPRRLVTIVAPASGVVIERGVTAGTSVDPAMTLLTIADLSRVWVMAEVPEAEIPGIRAGTNATLDFPASGLQPFAGRVDFVYPTLTERTRTLRVRFSVANPGGTLRPGLYGTAVFTMRGEPVLTVPRDAVVDTGREQHVFVSHGEHFVPRVVTLGVQLADRVEIRSGLTEGEQVVAAGVFLLDSESRLRATGGGSGEQTNPHAGHKM